MVPMSLLYDLSSLIFCSVPAHLGTAVYGLLPMSSISDDSDPNVR